MNDLANHNVITKKIKFTKFDV